MEIKGMHVGFLTIATFVGGTVGASFLTAAALETAGLVSIIASTILLGVCIAGCVAGFLALKEKSKDPAKDFFICFQEKLEGIIAHVFTIVIGAIFTGAARGITDGIAGRVLQSIKPPTVVSPTPPRVM